MEFNAEDKLVVLTIMERLDKRNKRPLFLRYWRNYLIAEIAKELKMSWSDTYKLLSESIDLIRKIILSESDFSEYSKRELLLTRLRESKLELNTLETLHIKIKKEEAIN